LTIEFSQIAWPAKHAKYTKKFFRALAGKDQNKKAATASRVVAAFFF
jgi:hypothetical protein